MPHPVTKNYSIMNLLKKFQQGLSILLFLVVFFLCSCNTSDSGSSYESPLIGDLGLRACHFSCDPGSNSGVTVVSAYSPYDPVCCVTFRLLGGGEHELCAVIRTWDGQSVTVTQHSVTSDANGKFEVCFEQEDDCFMIEISAFCSAMSQVLTCDVFDNQCSL